MRRYIDADNYKKDLIQLGFLPALVVSVLDKQPTADVVEVRHGEWRQVSEKYPRYVCTSCNHLFNNKEYKYCPNCGSKMNGGNK